MRSAQCQSQPIRLDIGCHQVRVLGGQKEQLFPVRSPAWVFPAARRNLILARTVRKACDVDLGLSRVVGGERHPLAVGRERCIGYIELRLYEREWFAIAEKWQNPDFALCLDRVFPPQIGEIPSIVTDGARYFPHASCLQQGFWVLSIEILAVNMRVPRSVGGVNDRLSIGLPDRAGLSSRTKREARSSPTRQIQNPHIRSPPRQVINGHGHFGRVWRNGRLRKEVLPNAFQSLASSVMPDKTPSESIGQVGIVEQHSDRKSTRLNSSHSQI